MEARYDFRMSTRYSVRIVSAIFTTPCLVVIYLNIEKWAEAKGYDSFLVGWANGAEGIAETSAIAALLTSGPILNAAIAITFLTIGLWVDWILRRVDSKRPSRTEKARQLGVQCYNAARTLQFAIDDIDGNIIDAAPKLHSVQVALRQFGIHAPSIDVKNEMKLQNFVYFLRHVGTLLEDGHIDEAKRAAVTLSPNVEFQELKS